MLFFWQKIKINGQEKGRKIEQKKLTGKMIGNLDKNELEKRQKSIKTGEKNDV